MNFIKKLIRKLILLSTCNRIPLKPPAKRVATKIPQRAHFIFGLWSDDPLPPEFQQTIDRWQRQGWEAKLWGRSEVEALIAKYPEVEAVYRQVPRDVQRADIARYLIVWEHGGFYMDCDAGPIHFSLLNFLQKKKEAEAVYFIEEVLAQKWIDWRSQHHMRQQIPEKHPEKICNYLFGSVSGHAVIRACLDEALRRCNLFAGQDIDDLGVLTTTGPEVTTDVVQSRRGEVVVRHSKYFCDHGRTGTWRNEP
ncbi:glycosyltransferase [Porticoccus sp. W117]|uniref:glycosyltransferase family 32 protein n=1 Tax=Porticoccus sp. W117 TaxID=3054777 RepID=UPI00259343D1|nr:glycosyltransferase [Porticoccus sp. W117]MDM3870633.1 glycosyltransferase [Porticoccus sp. W117]